MIYLDYAATTPIRTEVLRGMLPYLQHEFGNPGSIHDLGGKSWDAIQNARQQIAHSINAASAREILFTSSGTESNNLAIMGAVNRMARYGSSIITSSVEHPSVLQACKYLEKKGITVTYLPVDQTGRVRLTDLQNAYSDDTILVSIMAANNEVGTLQPIKEISEWLIGKKALLHTDAIQLMGKLPIDVQELKVDLLSIGGHKIYGPKGIGALYLRKGVRIDPVFYGGGQERDLRPSTLNTPGIVGLGIASELIAQEAHKEIKKIRELRDYCWQQMQTIESVELNGHPSERLPNLLNVSFKGIEGQAVLLELNRKQIYVSSGSACSVRKHAPSHVLLAMGKGEDIALQSLRITLGRETTKEQIDIFIKELQEVIDYFRKLRN